MSEEEEENENIFVLYPGKVSDLKRILLSIPDQQVREMQLNIQKVRLGHTLYWRY